MPKSYTTPNVTLHWFALVENPVAIPVEASQAILLDVPVAHQNVRLQLPANPADGDWYEYGDPLGLVGANYPLHIETTDGSSIDGAPSPFISVVANSGGKLVYIDDPALGAAGGWVHTAVTP
jgi:hypothetical protein